VQFSEFRVGVEPADLIHLSGELDVSVCGQLERALSHSGSVIVDASRLTFLDASGIRTLLLAREGAEQRGDRFIVVGLQGAPLRVVRLTGVEARLCELTPSNAREPSPRRQGVSAPDRAA
jgi:anti-anti-sigma factor